MATDHRTIEFNLSHMLNDIETEQATIEQAWRAINSRVDQLATMNRSHGDTTLARVITVAKARGVAPGRIGDALTYAFALEHALSHRASPWQHAASRRLDTQARNSARGP